MPTNNPAGPVEGMRKILDAMICFCAAKDQCGLCLRCQLQEHFSELAAGYEPTSGVTEQDPKMRIAELEAELALRVDYATEVREKQIRIRDLERQLTQAEDGLTAAYMHGVEKGKELASAALEGGSDD